MKFSAASILALTPLASTLVGASPLVSTGERHQLERRVAASAPHFVAYSETGENGPPAVSALSGFNNLVLAFLLTSGPVEQAAEWAALNATTRSSIHSSYSAAGVNILVSAFGSTEAPTTSGLDAAITANTLALWVKLYGLDGIDIDYEDLSAFSAGTAEAWLITFSETLRAALPSGQYIISHAPQAPFFSSAYLSGPYIKINTEVGSLIDWYNVQFYNEGSDYTTCDSLLTTSTLFPDTAVFQIASTAGVPLDKIVIGKPGSSSDAAGGYIAPATLATCLAQAEAAGFNGGVSVWQFPEVGTSWITAVRASSWPVST